VVPRWVQVFDKMYDDLKSENEKGILVEHSKTIDAEEF